MTHRGFSSVNLRGRACRLVMTGVIAPLWPVKPRTHNSGALCSAQSTPTPSRGPVGPNSIQASRQVQDQASATSRWIAATPLRVFLDLDVKSFRSMFLFHTDHLGILQHRTSPECQLQKLRRIMPL